MCSYIGRIDVLFSKRVVRAETHESLLNWHVRILVLSVAKKHKCDIIVTVRYKM